MKATTGTAQQRVSGTANSLHTIIVITTIMMPANPTQIPTVIFGSLNTDDEQASVRHVTPAAVSRACTPAKTLPPALLLSFDKASTSDNASCQALIAPKNHSKPVIARVTASCKSQSPGTLPLAVEAGRLYAWEVRPLPAHPPPYNPQTVLMYTDADLYCCCCCGHPLPLLWSC